MRDSMDNEVKEKDDILYREHMDVGKPFTRGQIMGILHDTLMLVGEEDRAYYGNRQWYKKDDLEFYLVPKSV